MFLFLVPTRCAVDQTVAVLSPRHEKHFQFSMEAFKFIGSYDQVNRELFSSVVQLFSQRNWTRSEFVVRCHWCFRCTSAVPLCCVKLGTPTPDAPGDASTPLSLDLSIAGRERLPFKLKGTTSPRAPCAWEGRLRSQVTLKPFSSIIHWHYASS